MQDHFTQLAKGAVEKVQEHLPDKLRNKITEKLCELKKMTHELPKLTEALGALSDPEKPKSDNGMVGESKSLVLNDQYFGEESNQSVIPDTRSGNIDIEPTNLSGLEKRGPISPISGRSFNSKTTSLRKLEG